MNYVQKRRKKVKWRRLNGSLLWHTMNCKEWPGHDYEELTLPLGVLPTVGVIDPVCSREGNK